VVDEASLLAAEFLTTVAGNNLLAAIERLPGNEAHRAQQVMNWDFHRFYDSLDASEAKRFAPLMTMTNPSALRAMVLSVSQAVRRAGARYQNCRAFGHRLLFTEELLAQASSPDIALHHALGLSGGSITDLGCGAGVDSIAFASMGARVTAVERNPVNLTFAHANAKICGLSDRIEFHQADAAEFPVATDFVFADPARRTETGTRVSRHADQYSPPLSVLVEKIKQVRGGCLKLSPLLPDEMLMSLGGRVEFLSENRECKEACVWFGEAGGQVGKKPFSAHFINSDFKIVPEEISVTVRPVGLWVYEPDPAVIRVGGVANAATMLDAGLVSAEDVYLTSDTLHHRSPLARAYQVVASMPFNRKEVAAYVRKAGYGRVVVKKRRARMEPEAVLAEIKASNRGPDPEIVLILIREARGHIAVFCTRSLAES
jgi:SAM-dependent methyltransferase